MITEILSNVAALSENIIIIIAVLIAIVAVCVGAILFFQKKRIFRLFDFDFGKEQLFSEKECVDHMMQLAQQNQQFKLQKHIHIIDNLNKLAYKHLNDIRIRLSHVSSNIISMIPAARWLFDNFYTMYRELKKIQSAETRQSILPVFTKGLYKGYPRVYILAREMVLISGKHLKEDNIVTMLNAFQSVTPLTSAELWVFLEMLGLCLLESIIHIATDILHVIDTKAVADRYVHERIAEKVHDANLCALFFSGMPKEKASDTVFLSHVLYCLKNMSIDDTLVMYCMESLSDERLKDKKPSDIFSEESRFEANLESVIRALIVSLREANNVISEVMFDEASPIEKILNQDPARIYNKMDFETRNRYRRAVEKLSRRYKLPEWDVAQRVLLVAEEKKNDVKLHCSHHVGTYLIGKGRPIFRAILENKTEQGIKAKGDHWKGRLYFCTIAFLSLLALVLLSWAAIGSGFRLDHTGFLLFIIAALFPVMGIAIELANQVFTHSVPTHILPSMDFIKEIPDAYRTFVVMPVILGNIDQVKLYVSRMEKYYFANMQRNLYFAILGDFADAPERVMPQDDIIAKAATEAIDRLNRKYPSEHQKFSLFIRYRKWNESEGCWMGWERKRGKLEEFNTMLCGDEPTTFSIMQGDRSVFETIKYVITIDADTDLIRDSAAKFVGIMAHPLNRPVLDLQTNKVKEGYAIIQSEVRNHILTHHKGQFSKTFAGQPGIDPYSNVVADVYQDTFEEGTYVGKGIYDVRILHRILHNTFPDNSVLSHDLLESSYARCAFSSGVKLMDTYPSSVASYAKREHRWIRGDWQLLPWLFRKSPISGVSRWKIFDNLRRSLVPVCRLAVLLIAIFLLPGAFYLWLPIMFFSDIFHIVLAVSKIVMLKIRRPMSRISTLSFSNSMINIFEQAVYRFVLLPFRAWIALDAIIRTLYRLLISHKKLLQWQTAESAETGVKKTLAGYYASMWAATLPAVIMAAAAIYADVLLAERIFYIFVGILWVLSPAIAYYISRPYKIAPEDRLKDADKTSLRLLARRTWQFFKDFSVPENNWLCPDNYQLSPSKKTSDKTSPTDIGLQLLSLMSARDMGYSGLLQLTDDFENVMYTLSVLPKWHGHLYNWYHIKTLEILNPQYISTVDSGNFLAYMITLKNGLAELQDKPVFSTAAIAGIGDTFALSESDAHFPKTFQTVAGFIQELRSLHQKLMVEEPKAWESAAWRKTLADTCSDFLRDAEELGAPEVPFSEQKTLRMLANSGSCEAAAALIDRISGLIITIDNMIKNMDFKPLFNEKRLLFHIGYNVSSDTIDSGYYDLMASESSLTSLVAIAKNDAPQKHWFKLGRPLTLIRGIPAFVSWSGTMFEYLMPNLVMKEYADSVFDQSSRAAVRQQMIYAKRMKIPWGLSESQYFRFDVDSNYQYRAFGVPKLRLQPSLSIALVVAPYATLLAMHLSPRKALENMEEFRKMGAEGLYGFYEALDFNSPDSSAMRRYSIVKCFMAHHQGMNLVSIDNMLNRNIMQQRFHREPMIKATQILLEETRGADVLPVARKGYSIHIEQLEIPEETWEDRIIACTSPVFPSAHWLSNGHYSMMLTSDGDGFSRCDDIMVNRWRSDRSSSAGSYIYVRDLSTNEYWSTSYKPTLVEPDEYQVIFSPHKAEYKRRDGHITTHTAITISPSKNLEVRKVTITNTGTAHAKIELTSYIENVLAAFLAELYHPVFNRISIESEYVDEHAMLISKSRKRTENKQQPHLVHMVKTDAKTLRRTEYETDRRRFLGRNNAPDNPDAIWENMPLSNTDGFSFDPISSLRVSIAVPAGRSATVSYITAVCASREDAISLGAEFSQSYMIEDVFEQFRMNSELEMKYLNMNNSQVNAIQDLVGPIHYSFLPFRGPAESIERNWKNQSMLWRFGISGDNPILLLRVKSAEETGLVKDVLKAYEYMRINQMKVDLIILSEEREGYAQELNCMLAEMTCTLKVYDENLSKPSLYILYAYQMQSAEIDLLMTVACIVFSESTGVYFRKEREQIEEIQKETKPRVVRPLNPVQFYITDREDHLLGTHLEFFNGFGGFGKNGTEYEILLDKHHKPPMPWINVIANDHFGFHVSETGAGYTWSVNSRENKLTAWSNDPVTDPLSEALYIRDQETGKVSSPTAMGSVQDGFYRVRHGFGYSVFEHTEQDLQQELTMLVPLEEPVRLWKLSIKNTADFDRKLEATLFIDWVLGVDKELSAPYVVTDFNDEYGYLSAKSIYNYHFRKHTAFLFSSEEITSFTGDRREFLGINGLLRTPIGLDTALSGNTGAGLEPCGVIRVAIELKPGEKKEIVFGLGQSQETSNINALCSKYKNAARTDVALEKVHQYWNQLLQVVSVTTSDRALDIMANGWLLYQTMACRIKARSAFYQCGGAYGFRDQLQDVLAFLDADPQLVRSQILTACSRQFEEGDVQHWWHPPVGTGVRTRFSDDLLWLPYVTAAYIDHTDDYAILDEKVSFIKGPVLTPSENEVMFIPEISEMSATVYEHCLLAIQQIRFGTHGLPLMGGGDWNDGMNHVGIGGQGESVWLAWFAYAVYKGFLPACRYKKDLPKVKQYKAELAKLKENIDDNAWDGDWYLRAYYDDGEKLGSKDNEECMIDSISQSWSVISGGGGQERKTKALYSARRYLVKPEEGMSLLLTPPFDKTPKDPGYIKDYYPGIRENGGQYTHAAVWLAIANAMVKDCKTASYLLSMLNPINITSSQKEAAKYEKEPYVIPADISMGASYAGRGGWTWYTGSSGWMYQALVRWFLGVRRKESKMILNPAVPASFGEYTVKYLFGNTQYIIKFETKTDNSTSVHSISLDGRIISGNSFDLIDDRKTHYVIV